MLKSAYTVVRFAGLVSSRANRNRALLQGVAGAVALALGFWGWMIHEPPKDFAGWFNNVFRTIQLITLQFPTSLEQNIPWQLHVARLAVPMVAALATFDVLVGAITRPMRLALMPSAKDHVVLVGPERMTEAALKGLCSRGVQIVVVSPTIEPAQRETLESFGVTVVEGDPQQSATLSGLSIARAAAIFLTHDDDLKNIDLAMQIMKLTDIRDVSLPPLALGLLIAREDIARELDATLDNVARQRRVRYHRLCPDRDGIREDLHTLAPVYLKADRTSQSHVLIIGLHGQWEQVLMQLIVVAQDHPELPPLFTIVAGAADLERFCMWRDERPDLALVAAFAVIEQGSGLLPSESTTANWRNQTHAPQLVVIMRPDADAVAVVLALRRPANVFGLSGQPMLIRRLQEDRLLGQMVGSASRAIAFGGIIRASAIERILDRKGDERAIALHAHYLDNASALGIGSPAALVAWDALPENLRDANRASAGHADILLAAAGLDPSHLPEVPHDLLEKMARIEHRRWITDRIDRGWRSGPERDNDRLIHPSIKPFDALTPADQEKDRNAVSVLLRLTKSPKLPSR